MIFITPCLHILSAIYDYSGNLNNNLSEFQIKNDKMTKYPPSSQVILKSGHLSHGKDDKLTILLGFQLSSFSSFSVTLKLI